MFSCLHSPPPQIEFAELQHIICSLKPFKAPGLDDIQNVLLKNLPSTAIDWLTQTFNKCFSLSYWPKSLQNAIGKLLEKLVYIRLINIIEEKNLLPRFQFGFRKGHSTIHQAARIKQFIQQNKNAKKSTGLVLLEIEKAFDSI